MLKLYPQYAQPPLECGINRFCVTAEGATVIAWAETPEGAIRVAKMYLSDVLWDAAERFSSVAIGIANDPTGIHDYELHPDPALLSAAAKRWLGIR